jgi:ribulose-phosphate 3-epimerase
MSIRILPSIASADMLDLRASLGKTGDYVHIDIEDGNFVPNITFGMKTVSAVCAAARGKEIDVHLLVTNPLGYLDALAELGVAAVCAHIEALPYPLEFLNRARALNMRAGIALNIRTPLVAVQEIREDIDYLLLMTAEPDDKGCQLYPPALRRAMEAATAWPVPVIADGGLSWEAVAALEAKGVFAAVLGRQYFREER